MRATVCGHQQFARWMANKMQQLMEISGSKVFLEDNFVCNGVRNIFWYKNPLKDYQFVFVCFHV